MVLGFLMAGMLAGIGAALWALLSGAGILMALALYAGGGALATLLLAGLWLLWLLANTPGAARPAQDGGS